MIPHRFIKHKNYMDICLKVISSFSYGHGYKIKAEVWNMGFVESRPIGIKIYLNIAKQEADIKPSSDRNTALNEWQMLLDQNDQCYRYSKWKDL